MILLFANFLLLLIVSSILPALNLFELGFIIISIAIGIILVVSKMQGHNIHKYLPAYFLINGANFLILIPIHFSVYSILGILVNLLGIFSSRYISRTSPVPEFYYDSEKYVSSKSSSLYHTEECRFAKNIPDKNRVLYHSKPEAEADGKKPHTCV